MSHRRSESRTTFVGLDVHKDSITSAVLVPGSDDPLIDRFFPDDASIRRFIGGLGEPRDVVACYEAGPTGYWLCRRLTKMGVDCQVIAPSLTPIATGQRVKTDKRDARRLVRLHRAGELTAIAVPTVAQEAVRDLCRTRGDLVIDRTRARHRLSKFLLRHDVIFREGTQWTLRHEAWLGRVRFDEPALNQTFARYRSVLRGLDQELAAVERDCQPHLLEGTFADAVARLSCYRGMTELGALHLASEVGDWRRFPRATSFMAFCGITPSEYSSGERTARGSITKTGNQHLRTALIEASWAYQFPARVTKAIERRQGRAGPDTVSRAWAAQVRLSSKFRRLASRKSSRNVVVTAIARELAGFLWAEMVA